MMAEKSDSISLDRPHPMAEAVLEEYAAMRKARYQADKLAHQMYRDVTGQALPAIVTFTDPDGTLWALHADVRLERVRKGEADGSGD